MISYVWPFNSQHFICVLSQVSTNIIRKYSGLIDIWLSLWNAQNSLNGQMQCLLNEHPRRSYAAMSQHLSQWVWYVIVPCTLICRTDVSEWVKKIAKRKPVIWVERVKASKVFKHTATWIILFKKIDYFCDSIVFCSRINISYKKVLIHSGRKHILGQLDPILIPADPCNNTSFWPKLVAKSAHFPPLLLKNYTVWT